MKIKRIYVDSIIGGDSVTRIDARTAKDEVGSLLDFTSNTYIGFSRIDDAWFEIETNSSFEIETNSSFIFYRNSLWAYLGLNHFGNHSL